MKSIVVLMLAMSLFSLGSFAQECDYKVEILVEGSEFDSQDFKWRMRATKIEGKSTNITGTAEIESNGKTAKSYKPWTSDSIAKQKTSSEYSPNLKPGSYDLTAEISVECDDTNKGNNIDKKEIMIKGTEEAKTEKSKEPEPEKSEGKEETILQSTAAKKDTASEAKSQQPSKTKQSTEEFDNVIELKSQNNKKSETPITANAMQNPENPELAYESSNEKARGWIMIFLLTLSVLLNIVLIWKR